MAEKKRWLFHNPPRPELVSIRKPAQVGAGLVSPPFGKGGGGDLLRYVTDLSAQNPLPPLVEHAWSSKRLPNPAVSGWRRVGHRCHSSRYFHQLAKGQTIYNGLPDHFVELERAGNAY